MSIAQREGGNIGITCVTLITTLQPTKSAWLCMVYSKLHGTLEGGSSVERERERERERES